MARPAHSASARLAVAVAPGALVAAIGITAAGGPAALAAQDAPGDSGAPGTPCAPARAGGGGRPAVRGDDEPRRGELELVETAHGEIWRYVPEVPEGEDGLAGMLVVVHGSFAADETAVVVARTFAERWRPVAESAHAVLIAPAFDEARYQRAYGGYRGLFGRDVGADVFVAQLVERHARLVERFDGRFHLYGHSAGAQFAGRFAVRHPGSLAGVVLSAPGRYAYPDPDAPWPYGMGAMSRTLDRGLDTEPREVEVDPDPAGWTRAATDVPIAVVVGSEDLEPQPARPAHRGDTRVELARSWVDDMRALARAAGREPRTEMRVVEGVGHSSALLTDTCAELFRARLVERLERSAAGR